MTLQSLRLAALSMAMLLPSLGTSIANVALPEMAAAFGVTSRDVQWVVIAYLVSLTAFIIGAGRMGDILGRRRVLLAAAVLFSMASTAAVFAHSLWVLVALRALQGLAAAALASLSMALVGDMVPKEQTGRAMGLLGTVSAVGTALGPTLGGALVQSFGWPAVFAVLGWIGVATLALSIAVLPKDTAPRKSAGFDLAGTAILPITLAAYALTTTISAPLAVRAGLAALALAGLWAFLWVERRATAPLLDLALLKSPELARGLPSLLLISTIVMATLVVGPFYLSQAIGLSPMAMGLVMSAGPAVAALGGRPAGGLIDRHGAGKIIRIGLPAVLSGSVMMATLPGMLGLSGYLGSLLVVTAGYALFQTANSTTVMHPASAHSRGVTSALLGLARSLGLITGASVMAAVYSFPRSLSGASNDQAGLTATFAVATLLAAIALAITRRSGMEAPSSR
jgi:MFS family permease